MAGGLDPGLEHTAYFTPDQSTYANGTTVCEVSVDVETGCVKIERLVIAHDCGRVINPLVVDGQVVGGVAHAIGNALMERIVFDGEAQPLTTNFGEYLLPLATDVPRVEIIHLETPSPLNPLGIKGAGEGGTIPTIAAILNAVNNALAPLGAVLREVPILPHRVLEAVNEATLRGTT
jgi:carbon-monoxide dehydrogenase large subunit